MFNYRYKPERDRVLVSVHDTSGRDVYSLIKKNGKRFGYVARKCIPLNEILPCVDISHLIVVSDRPFYDDIVSRVEKALDTYHSASIAFSYKSLAEALAFKSHVDCVKARTADRLNVLMPDVFIEGRYCVSMQKLLDNAVCDTVRVKYKPIKRHDGVYVKKVLRKEVKSFFGAASELYRKHKMWFRSCSDGYFAHRVDGGVAVTATKTKKTPLDFNRISVVHGYCSEENAITYSGDYLPSSDCVELSVLLKREPGITAVIHTHASDLITRNRSFACDSRIPSMPYGEVEIGDEISKRVSGRAAGLVLLEEHGEVFFGDSAARVIEAAEVSVCSVACV